MMGMAGVLACWTTTVPEPSTVRFAFTAPFCGSVTAGVRMSIDSVLVATDTFSTLAIGGVKDTLSAAFAVPSGTHRLGARVTSGFGTGYAWPDTIVVLAPAQELPRTLNFYCS